MVRRQTVELGFADLKEHRMLRRFSGRGPKRARTEIGLAVLARNLLVVSRGPPERTESTRQMQTPLDTAP